MYSDVPRDASYLARLTAFIQRAYGIAPRSIAPAKRGFFGETWRLDAPTGSYFLKLDYSVHQSIYERSFPALEHMRRCGIDFVSRIVPATDGALCTRFDGAVLGLFDWIDGENVETNETKCPEYRMLAKVYAVPTDGLDLPREDFGAGSAERFYCRWAQLPEGSASALFEAHRATLAHRANRLRHFAALCSGDTSHMHLTHGDAGGNLIIDGDRYYIVDWDDPRVAPPERDAWFMCPHDWARAAFHEALQGGGIDYTLRPERLAYYCYHTFFYYLNEHLDCLEQTGASAGLEGFFESWVEGPIRYADRTY